MHFSLLLTFDCRRLPPPSAPHTQRDSLPPPAPLKPLCTQPMVSCSAAGDPLTYSGYVIELFRLVLHDQGLTEGSPADGDFYFQVRLLGAC